jgi:pSer/pThr/pTyr-binding forkhead associated (FHA) protein
MVMALLVGMSADVKGRRFEIERDEVKIGRRQDNDIVINDPSVSSHHCCIVRSDRKYGIRDLESTNGTRVNGAAVAEQRLAPKDIVQIGSVEFMFDGEDVETDAADLAATTEIEVTAAPVAAPDSFRSVSPFGSRRSDTRIWWGLITIVALLALVLLVIFFVRL